MNAQAPVSPEDLDAKSLLAMTAEAVDAADALATRAREVLGARVKAEGRVSGRLLEQAQFGSHAYAWTATYVEALRQMHGWAERLIAEGTFGETEQLIL
ncbi:MAG: acyl-CoA dehydrogenase, partial [Pseudomonadota bacterium]